ncbi:MAG: gamma-glutamyltransferase [Pseudomonadota bacterium]
MSRPLRGAVAAGHEATAAAATEILEEGGNAFDAALAAMLAACVAEPVLASLGGGGFMLAHPAAAPPRVFDFFVQTPRRRPTPADVDFRPILADFGTAQQEFHIGLGTIATPGVVAGMQSMHRELCRLPLPRLAEPAVRLARNGVEVNAFQHYIATIIEPILRASPEAFALHRDAGRDEHLAEVGERIRNPDLGDALESLAGEGAALFYRGEMGARLAKDCRAGGWLEADDLSAYRVATRAPLIQDYRGARIFLNPAPSIGGTLIAFTLALLEESRPGRTHGTPEHLLSLAEAMHQTRLARDEFRLDFGLDADKAARLLDPATLAHFGKALTGIVATRGTTHISVADNSGNLASLTLSNGEGSGYVLPGTGIMLNNMLGEEDLNVRGFHAWKAGKRVGSMMSPTLAMSPEGTWYALGSGGSNRIRSAILQVLVNLIDFAMTPEQAVSRPRIHLEGEQLSMEQGMPDDTEEALSTRFPDLTPWPATNLFFGGVHSVQRLANGTLSAAGDPRRGGVGRLC